MKYLAALFIFFPFLVRGQAAIEGDSCGHMVKRRVPITQWHSSAGDSAWALILYPDDYDANPTKNYPLFYFWHGEGQGTPTWPSNGSTVCNLLTDGLPKMISSGLRPHGVSPIDGIDYKFIVVAIQYIQGSSYQAAPLVHYSLPYLKSILRVDTQRVYVSGLSAGGNGTWDMIADLFDTTTYRQSITALMPQSPVDLDGGRQKYIRRASRDTIPVLISCGTLDGFIVPARAYRDSINLTIPPPYVPAVLVERPGQGHSPSAWDSLYSLTFRPTETGGKTGYEWLLQWKKTPRGPQSIIPPSTPISFILPAPNRYWMFPGEYTIVGLDRNSKIPSSIIGMPVAMPGAPPYAIYGAGGAHNLHVVGVDTTLPGRDTTLYSRGDNNSFGQIGDSTITPASYPTLVHITKDSAGRPFKSIVYAHSGGTVNAWSTHILKSDGTVWVCGGTDGGIRGNGTPGGTNPAFVQIPFPAGVVIKQIAIDIVGIALDSAGKVWTWGAAGTTLGIYNLAQGTTTPNYYTPTMIAFAGSFNYRAVYIAGGGATIANYAVLDNGQVYGWGPYVGYLGIGAPGDTLYNRINAKTSAWRIDTALNLPSPIRRIYVNETNSCALLADSSIWCWGDAANGTLGNGLHLDFSRYTTNPAPYGGTPSLWSWNQGLGQLFHLKPVNVAPGKHNFTNLFCGSVSNFYWWAEDANDSLFVWGRDKGAVLGSGVTNAAVSGSQSNNYPNSWDRPWITQVHPFSQTSVFPAPCPLCLINPSAPGCPDYTTPPVASQAKPSVNAGGNKTTAATSFTLAGKTTFATGAGRFYSYWSQVSGPNIATFTFVTGDTVVAGNLITGNYVFKLWSKDNNLRVDSQTMTLSVNPTLIAPTVGAGSTQTVSLPIASVTLSGTATGNGGATITSTAWTQVSGPNTATITTPGSLTTTVTNVVQGVYVFKLTATDNNNLSSSSTVQLNAGSCNCLNFKIPTNIK